MTAVTAAVVAYSTMPLAHAQAPKKPIYDDDEESEAIAPFAGTARPAPTPVEDTALTKSEIVSGVTVRSSEYLEKYVGVARSWLYGKTEIARTQIDSGLQKYLNVERSITSTVNEIRSDKEDILPGGIYVLVSTLSGSIIARNRNFLIRGISPVVFGVVAFRFFLPETYSNTGKLIWKFEQKVPEIAEAHTSAHEHVDGLVKDVNTAVSDSKAALTDSVHSARKFVAKATGLEKK